MSIVQSIQDLQQRFPRLVGIMLGICLHPVLSVLIFGR